MESTSLNKVWSVLFKLITLVILAIAGVWIAALIMGRWYSLELSGSFVKWNELDSLQKFNKIVNVDDFELRAQAADGKVYSYTTTWKEWQPEPGNIDRGSNAISTDCDSLYRFHAVLPRYPPPEAGMPVQCGVVKSMHPMAGSVDTAYYVLLDNGNLWMWRHTRDPQQEYVILFAGLFIGLIAGIIVWSPTQKWI